MSNNPIKTQEQIDQDTPLDVKTKGLRTAWKVFANEYVKNGGNATQAYLKAYPESSYESANANAQRLIVNDSIKEEINNILNFQRITDEFIYNGFFYLYGKHKDGKGAVVACMALEKLAKMKGLLVDTKKFAFDGDNPAVFPALVKVENKEKWDKEVAEGKRITE